MISKIHNQLGYKHLPMPNFFCSSRRGGPEHVTNTFYEKLILVQYVFMSSQIAPSICISLLSFHSRQIHAVSIPSIMNLPLLAVLTHHTHSLRIHPLLLRSGALHVGDHLLSIDSSYLMDNQHLLPRTMVKSTKTTTTTSHTKYNTFCTYVMSPILHC